MRSSTFYNFAFLATSLLAKDALAAPYDRRAVVNENVVVTQVATVIQQADGSFVTQVPEGPVAAPVAAPTPAPSPAPEVPAPEIAAPKQAAKAEDTPEDKPSPVADAPPASSPASGGSSLSSKRGLPYNDASLLKGFVGSGSKATWCYNWASTSGDIPSGLEYSPMLHGLTDDKTGPWSANANAAIAKGATHLQAMNEPDVGADKGGTNTSPQDAANGYMKYMMPFYGKAKIGSPAVSNGVSGGPQGAMGIPFIKDFWSKCSGCKFDFASMHWYGNSAEEFKNQVQAFRDAAKAEPKVAKDANGNPTLWITEFGLNGADAGGIAKFLGEVMPWLDSQDYVERYAYQWVADGFLVSGTSPNVAGKAFAGLA